MAKDNLMTILGMICIATSEFLGTTEDTITKLSLNLNGSQMIFATDVIQIFVVVIWWNILRYNNKTKQYGPWYGKKEYRKPVWFYGFFVFMDIMLVWYGIRLVPIGNAMCILTLADLITMFIAWIYLKEELLKTFIPALIIEIISVAFIIQQPRFVFEYLNTETQTDGIDNINEVRPMNIYGLIAVLLAAVTYSGMALMVRLTVKKNDDDDAEVEEVHFLQFHMVDSFECVLIFVPLMMIINTLTLRDAFIGNIDNIYNEWKYDTQSLLTLFVLGVIDVASGMFKVIGYMLGDVTKVVWFENVDLLSSYMFQIFVFGNVPNTFEIIGIVLSVVVLALTMGEEVYEYFYEKERDRLRYQNVLQSDSNYDTEITESSAYLSEIKF